MRCASPLRTIFTSLTRTNEGVQVHNKRNYPRAKFDSERNVRFLFNKHGDLYFSLHNNSVHIILLKKSKKKIIRRKKRYRWNSAQNHYSLMQIMTTTTTRTVWRLYIVLNSEIFQQILYDIVLIYMLDTFYLPSFFLGITYTVTIFWATAECNMERWIMHMSGTSTGMNGVKLAHHMS